MLNTDALVAIISSYKQNFDQIHKEEIYKWKAVKCFQDNWDEKATDFPEMLNRALDKAKNLLMSYNFYAKGMIYEIAKKDPEAVRAMFIALFDELQPVTERIENFIESADELRLKYGGGAWGQHYQSANSISIYLFFRYPNKYYIYKYRKFKDFASKIDYSVAPKMGNTNEVKNYFDMCNEILELVKKDNELLNMSKNRLTQEDSPDNDFHILTEDIVYYGSKQIENTIEGWWPTEEEYHPGIDKEKWLQLLSDKDIFTPDSKAIMKRMLDIGGEATCTQLSRKYGKSKNYYNSGSSSLAKRICQVTNCDVMTRNNENSRWWPILYIGKHADKNIPGVYIWRLRSELMDALKEIDLSAIPLYSKSIKDSSKQVNNWWLNANPKIWSFSDIQIGEEQGYTLVNENGNKRRIYENFLAAKTGDLVIGYESTPVKQIVALCKISRENDGKSLYFEKIEVLSTPIEYSIIKDIAELRQMEFFVNPNGSLFKLTKDEYELLIDIIRDQNPLISNDDEQYDVYTKQDFLSDVFLSEEEYDSLVALLEYKKNIILQGAPGVGKTFAAKRLAYSILGREDDNRVKIVQFHQNYSYEDFIMGYKPDGTGFKLQTGIFYEFCKQAENNPDDKFFFIIDEINRGNLSKIFGELLMTIEKEYRGKKITIAYSGLQFFVPDNIYIIGMMNTADRSLAIIDYALRRRFSFFDMVPAFEKNGFKSYQQSLNNKTFDDLIELVKELNRDIEKDASLGKGFCIGHSYFCGQEICTEEWLYLVINHDIIQMLNEYWFDNEVKTQTWARKLLGVLHD
jgi:5-methylcytosine-specific restriction protein B